MTFHDFTAQEITALVKVLDNTIDTRDDQSDLQEEATLLKETIQQRFFRLKPTQRNRLIGYINEYFIFKNDDLKGISDCELLFRDEKLNNRLLKMDLFIALINKLKVRSEKPKKLFKDKLDKLDSILLAKRVYYSKQSNGHVYKAGFLLGNGKGLKLDLGNDSPITRLNITGVAARNFEASCSPLELFNHQ